MLLKKTVLYTGINRIGIKGSLPVPYISSDILCAIRNIMNCIARRRVGRQPGVDSVVKAPQFPTGSDKSILNGRHMADGHEQYMSV